MSRARWPDSTPGFPINFSFLFRYPRDLDSVPKPIGLVSTLVNAVTIAGSTAVRGGAATFVTAGADLDGIHLATPGSPFKGDLGTSMRLATRVSIDTDVTQSWLLFGWGSADTNWATGVPNNCIYFSKADGDAGTLKAIIRRGGANTISVTVATVVLATLLDLEIQVDYDPSAANTAEVRFLVNGAIKYRYNGTGVPDLVDVAAGFEGVLEMKAGSAAANTFTCVGIAGWQNE